MTSLTQVASPIDLNQKIRPYSPQRNYVFAKFAGSINLSSNWWVKGEGGPPSPSPLEGGGGPGGGGPPPTPLPGPTKAATDRHVSDPPGSGPALLDSARLGCQIFGAPTGPPFPSPSPRADLPGQFLGQGARKFVR